MVVHLGFEEGKATASLKQSDAYTVHGLSRNQSDVDAARAHISSLGRYGDISVERLEGARLPYVENLINLIVVQNQTGISDDELMRVLAPNGAAFVQTGGTWTKKTKPRPTNIGEWTHFLQDAGNNPVAKDTVVGPPRRLQWVAPPLWLRSHETPTGFQGMVTGGGRLFYFLDEGPIGIVDERFPERWSLFCRDAFNGKLLWKRGIPNWGWEEWSANQEARRNPLESSGLRQAHRSHCLQYR